MFVLQKPTLAMEEELLNYKKEMIHNGDTGMSGCGGLDEYDDVSDWLHHIDSYRDKALIPPESNYVEGSQWVLIHTETNKIIGMINLRHYLSERLLAFGGHIGYSIRPSERGKGYATIQLTLALQIVREKGVTKVLITCDESNIASSKTIESCGGVLENVVYTSEYGNVKRYWITL